MKYDYIPKVSRTDIPYWTQRLIDKIRREPYISGGTDDDNLEEERYMAEEVIVRSKEKKYKGRNLEELKALDVRESAKFLPSGSRRSVLRNFQIVENFIKESEKKIARNKKIRTHFRDLVIVPRMVGMTIGVHNGKGFQDVPVQAEMIGHRLGEFAMTRGIVKHSSAGIGATKGSRAKKK